MPFTWHQSTGRIDLPIPEDYESARASDLNNHGLVVGSASRTNASPHRIAVAWLNGKVHLIGVLDGDNEAEATAVNDHGEVVGHSNYSVTGPVHGIHWSLEQGLSRVSFVDESINLRLRDINDAGVMVGLALLAGPFNQRGVIVDGDDVTMLDPAPGGISSEFFQINDAGDIFGAGFFDDGDNIPSRRVAIWRNGVATLIVPESLSIAQNVGEMNRWGQVVGMALLDVGAWPFVADARGVRSLDDWVRLPEGWTSVSGGKAINDHGIILTSASPGFMMLSPVSTDGDSTFDCRVDFDDLLAVLATWGSCDVPCSPDLDGDGAVSTSDLVAVLTHWTP